jgi:hypothetical protein
MVATRPAAAGGAGRGRDRHLGPAGRAVGAEAAPAAGAAAVERFDKITDCPALRLRYSQAHAIWKRSVRAGQEDQAELAAMRGTLRRLEQLGDCLPRT